MSPVSLSIIVSAFLRSNVCEKTSASHRLSYETGYLTRRAGHLGDLCEGSDKQQQQCRASCIEWDL